MSDETILENARERYKIASDGWRDIYDAAQNDMYFTYDVGEGQWPDEVKNERKGRPMVTVNKLQKFVRQITGDEMQNRPRMKVIPVDNKADVVMAELYNGLIRQIEYLSNADIAYTTAYVRAIASSVGYWRILTQYEDDNSFNQEIRIKRVINPLSILFDPAAEEFTLEDAQYCFVESMMSKKEFERLYPGADTQNFSGDTEVFGDWFTSETVRICEYYWKEPIKKQIAALNTGDVVELTKGYVLPDGAEIVRERTVDANTIKWAKVNGAEILKQEDWPGKYIPVIPVFGDEIIVNGKKYYLSLVRGAKGPQRMYNYWATAATETVALSPKSPFIVEHRQIKGFEREWEEANTKNRMYIRYNAIAGLQKPAREPQSQVPAAIMGMLQQTAYDIEDHLGRYEASKGETSNERSGKAIKARQQQSDKGTYTFVDNFNRAIIYCGKQLIDLIPKIYDTQRAVMISSETGEQSMVDVNTPVPGPNGKVAMMNDLSVGKYDLISTIGASWSSKREEMVQMMIEAMQYAPAIAPVLVPLVFKYSDWPGAQEVYQEVQKVVQQQQMMAAATSETPAMPPPSGINQPPMGTA